MFCLTHVLHDCLIHVYIYIYMYIYIVYWSGWRPSPHVLHYWIRVATISACTTLFGCLRKLVCTRRRHRQILDTLANGLFGLVWSALVHAFGNCLSQGVAIANFRIWSNPCLRKLAFTGRRHRQFLDALAYVSVCPCVRLPVCRSARLSVCLSISLSVLFLSLLLSLLL